MKFCKKDGNCHIMFEEGDEYLEQKEDGSLWYTVGCGLMLELHFQKE